MMPPDPVPHLIVPQAGLTLGSLEAFLNPMLRLRHAGQFLQRGLGSRIGKIIIMLELPASLTLPRDEQQLLRTRAPRRRPRPDPTPHDLHRQRPFLAVSHLDRRP